MLSLLMLRFMIWLLTRPLCTPWNMLPFVYFSCCRCTCAWCWENSNFLTEIYWLGIPSWLGSQPKGWSAWRKFFMNSGELLAAVIIFEWLNIGKIPILLYKREFGDFVSFAWSSWFGGTPSIFGDHSPIVILFLWILACEFWRSSGDYFEPSIWDNSGVE